MKFSAIAQAGVLTAGLMLASTAFAQSPQPRAPGKLAPSANRPPPEMLVDCAKAPKDAVTRLPADLASWATIYCTREGAIFNANETHFGAFPDSGQRASVIAGDLEGKKGAEGANSWFKGVSYTPLTDAMLQEIYKVDPLAAKIVNGKPARRLDLSTTGGMSSSFVVIDPGADPFWVFPLTDKGLGSPAFFVVSLAALNQAR